MYSDNEYMWLQVFLKAGVSFDDDQHSLFQSN